MKNYSPQTKSFIVLFCVAIIGTYLCLILATEVKWSSEYKYSVFPSSKTQVTDSSSDNSSSNTNAVVQTSAVDTSNWLTYTDSKYGFSFRYSPDWKVLPGKLVNTYYVLEIDPGKKYYNFKIYLSRKDFHGLATAPTGSTLEIIDAQKGFNLDNSLYGVKYGDYYYTFDINKSLPISEEFYNLVHSFKF